MDLLSRVPNVDLHPETWNGIVKCWIQPQSVARAWYGILILGNPEMLLNALKRGEGKTCVLFHAWQLKTDSNE